jgi:hypothetical protein
MEMKMSTEKEKNLFPGMAAFADAIHHLAIRNQEPFSMTDEERVEIAVFDSAIAQAGTQRVKKMRELAWKKGAAALKLEDLKPKCGVPFGLGRPHCGYQRAQAFTLESIEPEMAYLCTSQYNPEPDSDTCGWVKGEPRQSNYDNLGPLSGSAGARFYCRICNKQLSEYATMFS